MLTIDGSFGEGGGQILRSSVALSAITGTPFRIENIRANRDPPGLARQHLTAVLSAAKICNARVDGAELRSGALAFRPGRVTPGDYHFDVGSAGSTTLVLQTVLPPLLLTAAPSTLTLEGGTHNPFAPALDFLEHAFLPVVNRMGPRVEVALERPGFAPRGGGRLIVTVQPVGKLSPVELHGRGDVVWRRAKATVAGLPRGIAERELAVVRRRLGWAGEELKVEELPEAYGPGNVLALRVEGERAAEVFTGVGRRGVPAEDVAEDAVRSAARYLAAGVPVGDCLADQLLLPFALAGGGAFRTLALTRHAETNIRVIAMFLDVHIETHARGPDDVTVQCRPGAAAA